MLSIDYIASDESSQKLWMMKNMPHTSNSTLLSNQTLLLHVSIMKSERPIIHVIMFTKVVYECVFIRSRVRVVTSEYAGMGKSFYIQHLARNSRGSFQGKHVERYNTIPIHGPEVTADTVMEFLEEYSMKDCQSSLLHIDIAASVC